MRILISLVLGALALGTALAGSASAAMYWGNWSTVGVIEPDGTHRSDAFPTGGDSVLRVHAPICGVAVSPTHLYWNAYGVISRLDLAAGGAPQPLVSGLSSCGGVAIDGQYIFWATRDGFIGRANLDGSGADPRFINPPFAEPCGVAVGDDYVYWAGGPVYSVGRARLDGSEVEHDLVTGSGYAGCGIAVDGQHVYWAAENGIGRANLDGGEANGVFIPGYSRVTGIATWGPHLYWTEEGHPGTVGRAGIDGSAPNREFLLGQVTGGIVFDARPAPPRRLSSPVEVTKVKHLKGKGAVYVWVAVPGHGELTVKAKGARWRVLRDDRPLSRLGPFEVKLKLWPGAGGKEAKRVRKQLRREGRARVFLKLGYVEEDSLPISGGKSVELVRKRRG